MKHQTNPEPERLVVPTEFKATDKDKGLIEGHASIFGVEDLHGDIVEKGAFTKTIQERVPKGLVKMFDTHQWDIAHTLGTIIDAFEDSVGLQFKGKLSDAPSVQDAKVKMLEGHINRASIGYDPVIESWEERRGRGFVRHLKEIKLFEISPVPLASNELAIIGIKNLVPYQDLPLEKNHYAIPSIALKNVTQWALNNWSKFRKAFLYYDRERPTDPESYYYQIADVIDNELKAIPGLITECAEQIERDYAIEEAEKAEIKTTLERYFARMRKEFNTDSLIEPWKRSQPSFPGLYLTNGDKDLKEIIKQCFKEIPESERTILLKELAEPEKPLTKPEDRVRRLKALELDLQLRR